MKKIFAVFLTLVMIISMFAGCGGDPPDNVATEPTKATENTETPDTPDIELPTEEPTVPDVEDPTDEVTEPDVEVPTDKPDDKPAACTHDYKHTVIAPTTTAKGYTLHECKKCGHSYKDNYTDKLPTEGETAHKHSYKSEVTKPTCTTKGYTTHTCECGHSYTDSTVKATGHKYVSKVTAPTCEAKGYTTYTCKNCGDSYKDNEVKATGHKYETKTVAPTETAQGYDLHTCKTCGKSYKDNYTEKLPSHTHSYSKTVTNPTCDAKGYTTYKCSCGHSYTGDETAALGHNYTSKVTAPTCDNKGYTTHTCGRCGKSYTDSETAALGHSWSNWSVTKQPTVDAEGQETRTCGTCGKTETRNVDKLPDDGGDEGCTKHEYTWVCASDYKSDTGTCKNCGATKVIYASESKSSKAVVDEINAYRTAAGLNALTWSGDHDAIRIRAAEIRYVQMNHIRPDGSQTGRAECIAGGAGNAKAAVDAWYTSSSHYGIIMNPNATHAMAAYNGTCWVVWVV